MGRRTGRRARQAKAKEAPKTKEKRARCKAASTRTTCGLREGNARQTENARAGGKEEGSPAKTEGAGKTAPKMSRVGRQRRAREKKQGRINRPEVAEAEQGGSREKGQRNKQDETSRREEAPEEEYKTGNRRAGRKKGEKTKRRATAGRQSSPTDDETGQARQHRATKRGAKGKGANAVLSEKLCRLKGPAGIPCW